MISLMPTKAVRFDDAGIIANNETKLNNLMERVAYVLPIFLNQESYDVADGDNEVAHDFHEIFDPCMRMIVTGRHAKDAQAMDKLFMLAKTGHTFAVSSVKAIGPRTLCVELQADRFDRRMDMTITAEVSGSRIVRMEIYSVISINKVPGQVPASSDVALSPGSLTETAIAGKIAPSIVGTPLAEHMGLIATHEPQTVIRLNLDFGLLFEGSERAVVQTNGVEYAGGVHFTKPSAKCSRYTLRDRKGQAITYSVANGAVHFVYRRKPLQASDAVVAFDAEIRWYPWLCVTSHRSIEVWNGSAYEPLMQAAPPSGPASPIGQTLSSMFLGRRRRKQLVFTDAKTKSTVYGFLQSTAGDCELTLAPGVDPALMLSLAAIVGASAARPAS